METKFCQSAYIYIYICMAEQNRVSYEHFCTVISIAELFHNVLISQSIDSNLISHVNESL